MRMKSFVLLFCLTGACLVAPAAHAAPPPATGHNPPLNAEPAKADSRFDRKTALAVSQGVIGKSVGDYTLTAADGRKVRLTGFRGKPLVVSLVYTSCYHICPLTTQHLAEVVRTARAALGTDSFRVITIGFDTPHDTPTMMRQFERDQGVDIPGWEFLSADAAAMAGLTKDLGFLYYPTPHGFDHLIQATVIDARGKIYRQVYGTNFEPPLLVEPLKELVFGRPSAGSLLSALSSRIRLFCTVYDPSSGQYRFDYSIFIGIIIGMMSIGTVGFFLIREWRRLRRRAHA